MVQKYVVPNGIVEKEEQCKNKSLPHLRRFVEHSDYAALEKRCRELEELYNKAVEDVVTKAKRCKELEAENEKLRKRLERKHDFLSQALNEGDGVYRP